MNTIEKILCVGQTPAIDIKLARITNGYIDIGSPPITKNNVAMILFNFSLLSSVEDAVDFINFFPLIINTIRALTITAIINTINEGLIVNSISFLPSRIAQSYLFGILDTVVPLST